MFGRFKILAVLFLFASGFLFLATTGAANAAKLTLSWVDNSDSENGFVIERRLSGGSYQRVAQMIADMTNFTDANLAAATEYCYRVYAYNSSGNSAYSNESCATTPADTFALTVNRSGTGSGTVTSAPAGINCGADCAETLSSGTVVTLTAAAAPGSLFSGWSGHADCADGKVTMNTSVQCTATFNLSTAHLLTIAVLNAVTAKGSASGRVVSTPSGIDCGPDCAESYAPGQVVALTPIAGPDSKFAGWSGNGDCSDGTVTMTGATSCTAKFQLNAATLLVAKKGKGTIKATAAGIDCGESCRYTAAVSTVVTLRATPEPGSSFSGWSGPCSGTGDCNIKLVADTTVTANFFSPESEKIGIYRPGDGSWFLDRNGSGTWDGCGADLCLALSGGPGSVPVVGDWNRSGASRIGFFVSESAEWFLDANGNGLWDGCVIDLCSSFGEPADIPITGRWMKGAEDRIAVFRPSKKKWYLDRNGNESRDRCQQDKCSVLKIYRPGDLPVTGDWTGRGTTQLGLYRPETGEWFLDRNANSAWNGCKKDICIASFGSAEDIPVAGDWSGAGISRIGVFRPATGEWFLDFNGNGKWDGPALDLYVAGFGQPGDVPVVGKW